MGIELWNAKRLARALGRGEVSRRQKGYYLFGGFALWTIINATGLATASALWSWMSLFETLAVLLITATGVTKAYEAAGGDSNPDFVAEFTCLYVPVTITTTVVVWTVHWGIVYGFRETIQAISQSHVQLAINLSYIGSSMFGLLVFSAVVIAQAIVFYRLPRLLLVVQSQAAAANPVPPATPASGHA